jgi:hypothetical protein
VRGAVAVPVFLGRGANERAVAVLEAVFTAELLSVGDALSSLLAALSAAGLHPSANRSFVSAPAPPTQQQAAAAQRLAGVAEALCGAFEIPMAQLWLAGSALNDRSAHRGEMAPVAGAVPRLRARGAPGVTRVPAAWALRAACSERALAPQEGLPGAAWAAGAAVWVAARAALARTSEPLRPYHALFGADGGAFAVPVAPSSDDGDAPGAVFVPEAPDALVLELQLPPAMAGAAQLALLARLLPALAAACAAARLSAAIDASPDALAAMEAMARRAGMSRPPAAFVAAPPGAAAAATSGDHVEAASSFMEPWLSRLPGTKAVPGIAAVFFALAGAPSAQRAAMPAIAPRSSTAPETPALDAPDAAPPAADAAPPVAASPGGGDDEWQPCGEDLDGAGADGITMAQLRSVFTFPLKEAARRLNVCGTTLKCVCRKHGIARWPYRTLAKLSSNAVKLKHSVESIGVAHPQAAQGEAHRRPAPRPAGWGTPVGALRPLAQAAHMQVRRSARAAAAPPRKPLGDDEEAGGSEFDEEGGLDTERAADEDDAGADSDPFASDDGGSKRRGGAKRKRGQAASRRRAGGGDGSESEGGDAAQKRKARPAPPLVHEDSTMAAMLTELRGGDAAAVFAAAEAAARTPRPPPGTVKPKSRSGVRRPQPPVAAAAPPPAAKPPPAKVPTAKPKARRIVPAPPMARAAAVPASPVASALASPPAGLLPLASPPQFSLARFPLPAPISDTGPFGSSPHARAMLPPAGVYGGTPLFAPSPRRGAAVVPGSAPSSGGSGSGGEGGNVAAMWALPDFTSLWSATPGWPGGLAPSPAAAGAGAAWAASLPALFATPAPPQQQQGGGR